MIDEAILNAGAAATAAATSAPGYLARTWTFARDLVLQALAGDVHSVLLIGGVLLAAYAVANVVPRILSIVLVAIGAYVALTYISPPSPPPPPVTGWSQYPGSMAPPGEPGILRRHDRLVSGPLRKGDVVVVENSVVRVYDLPDQRAKSRSLRKGDCARIVEVRRKQASVHRKGKPPCKGVWAHVERQPCPKA
jgi:hypothetical protein